MTVNVYRRVCVSPLESKWFEQQASSRKEGQAHDLTLLQEARMTLLEEGEP